MKPFDVRAMELAVSGVFATWREIELTLRQEGYTYGELDGAGADLRRRVKSACTGREIAPSVRKSQQRVVRPRILD